MSTDFYKLLEIDRSADNEAIKRAYRKMALKHHPDKMGSDTVAVERFQKIVRAYEVLSDPKKRKIYDQYGHRGISMVEQMGEVAPFIDPELVFAMNWLFILASLLVALMILFPVFISIRADGIVQWNWAVVFIPMFIIDMLLLLIVLSIPDVEKQNEEELPNEPPKKSLTRFLRAFYIFSFIIFQILIVLELNRTLQVSWGIVFVPWFIMELYHGLAQWMGLSQEWTHGKTDMTTRPMEEGQGDVPVITKRPLTRREKILGVLDAFLPWFLRVSQAAVLCAKLDGSVNSSWAVVFIPLYLIGIYNGSTVLFNMVSPPSFGTPSQMNEHRIFSRVRLVYFIIVAILFYVALGLLIQRLQIPDTSTPTAAVIFIPLFIVLGLLLCCVGCCLPCIACLTRRAIQQELNQPEFELVGQQQLIEWRK